MWRGVRTIAHAVNVKKLCPWNPFRLELIHGAAFQRGHVPRRVDNVDVSEVVLDPLRREERRRRRRSHDDRSNARTRDVSSVRGASRTVR